MKLSTQILFLAALIALATFTTPAFAQQASNGAEVGPAIALNAPTRGVVFKTASINSDGTRAQSFRAVASIHLSTGTYQVTFDENVQALNGFSRWVQVDTLTTAVFLESVAPQQTAQAMSGQFSSYVRMRLVLTSIPPSSCLSQGSRARRKIGVLLR